MTGKMKRTLKEFQKNAETAYKIQDEFEGKFVAILEQDVVDSDVDYENLMNRISSDIIQNQELYVGYLQRPDESFVI
jgi:hypothetical protein